VESARHQLARHIESRPDAVPVLAVPCMGPKAREFARSEGLSWLDLSGNADVRGPGVRILLEGKPNRFASPSRPSTAFSDKASRISRAMLVEPERWWRQAELIEVSGLSTGYVSKVVGRLGEDDLLDSRPDDQSSRPRSPDLLLDAWAQVHDFRKRPRGWRGRGGGPATPTSALSRSSSPSRCSIPRRWACGPWTGARTSGSPCHGTRACCTPRRRSRGSAAPTRSRLPRPVGAPGAGRGSSLVPHVLVAQRPVPPSNSRQLHGSAIVCTGQAVQVSCHSGRSASRSPRS
jgi:hypothetical protein